VPIAFVGFDIAQLSPPLSLLQGFNLIGADGMNNVLALANQQFDLSFPEDFVEADYISVFGTGRPTASAAMAHVDEITVTVYGEMTSLVAAVEKVLPESRDTAMHDGGFRVFGASFVPKWNDYPQELQVRIDPSLFERVRPALDAMLPFRVKRTELDIRFTPGVSRVRDMHRVSALLYGTDVRLGPSNSWLFRDVAFEITTFRNYNPHVDDERPEQALLKCYLNGDNVGPAPSEIAELLWSRGILAGGLTS
jgi:hypothetical protein